MFQEAIGFETLIELMCGAERGHKIYSFFYLLRRADSSPAD